MLVFYDLLICLLINKCKLKNSLTSNYTVPNKIHINDEKNKFHDYYKILHSQENWQDPTLWRESTFPTESQKLNTAREPKNKSLSEKIESSTNIQKSRCNKYLSVFFIKGVCRYICFYQYFFLDKC